MKTKWPFFIAEIGVNHEGSMIKAKQMIVEAKNAGAHAVKFQTYKAHMIASKTSPSYWDLNEESTRSQFELFSKYDGFGEKDYQELAAYAKTQGVIFMSTAFDLDSVDLVDELVSIHKISSSDITNRPLIEKIASKGKPIILSVGASNVIEIEEALSWIGDSVDVALLHCVLQYPTPNGDANLGQILALKKRFGNLTIGYSDHTKPQSGEVLKVAVSLGAEVIEKHFTFDKSLEGNDHYHSFDYHDLKNFMSWYKEFYRLVIGNKSEIVYNKKEETARMNARRGVYTRRQLPVGHTIMETDIICRRPFTGGIQPREYYNIIGKKLSKAIQEDVPLTNNDIE